MSVQLQMNTTLYPFTYYVLQTVCSLPIDTYQYSGHGPEKKHIL